MRRGSFLIYGGNFWKERGNRGNVLLWPKVQIGQAIKDLMKNNCFC